MINKKLYPKNLDFNYFKFAICYRHKMRNKKINIINVQAGFLNSTRKDSQTIFLSNYNNFVS